MAFRLALAAGVWLFAAGIAGAQPVGASGMTLAEVASVLERNGLSVEIGKENSGEDAAFSQMNGVSFGLYPYGCGADGRCAEFLFSSLLELETPLTLEQVNEYNSNALAGRAFIDEEGAANIEHLFSVSGSQDADLVERNLMIWEAVLTDFAVFTGFWAAGS